MQKTQNCPNCGANMYSLKCDYCGVVIVPPPPPPQKSSLDKLFDGLNKLGDKVGSGIDKGIDKLKNSNAQSSNITVAEKNRLARIAISGGKCPNCATLFQAGEGKSYCNKCGSSINLKSYQD